MTHINIIFQVGPPEPTFITLVIFTMVFLLVLVIKDQLGSSSSKNEPDKYCSNCGEGLSSSKNFCSECGHPTKSAPDNHVMCTECGSINTRDDDFCTNCGNPSRN